MLGNKKGFIRKEKQRKIDPKRSIVSKTDLSGKILYANPYFSEVSEYSTIELTGAPHNILRHPDMPRAVFKLMWERLKAGKNIMAVVKNKTKSGDYYWVTTDFNIRRNVNGEIIAYMAFREAAHKRVVKAMKPIYAKMLTLEESGGMQQSTDYLMGIIEEKGMTYDEFILDLTKPKNLFNKLFRAG